MKASLATPLGEMRNSQGPHRLYAEAADHTQLDAQASNARADGTASARVTVKTVVDPKSDASETKSRGGRGDVMQGRSQEGTKEKCCNVIVFGGGVRERK